MIRRLLATTIFLLCMFSLMAADEVEITGIIELQFNGCFNPDHKGPETTLLVRDEKTHVLTELDAPGVDVSKVTFGKRVKVKGRHKAAKSHHGAPVFEFASMEYAAVTEGETTTGTTEPPASAQPAPPSNPVPLTCILIFANGTGYTYPADKKTAVENFMFNNAVNAKDAIEHTTLGHLTLAKSSVLTVDLNYDPVGVSWSTVSSDMVNKAGQLGPDPYSYDRIFCYLPSGVDMGGDKIMAWASGRRTSYAYQYSNNSLDVVVHELGHTFGFAHSGQGNKEYGDYQCVMGYGSTRIRCETFNGPKKAQGAWLRSWSGTEAQLTEDATYDIYPVSQNPGTLPGMRVIRIAGTDYYISYQRSFAPYAYVPGASANKVMVHTYSGNGSYARSWLQGMFGVGQQYAAGTTDVIVERMGPNLEYATVSFDFPDGNTKPVANPQSISVVEDEPTAITLTGSDSDGNTLTITKVTDPANGTLSGTAPNLTYIRTGGYVGADSFVFKVDDGKICSYATISISVVANSVPVADDQVVSTPGDIPIDITLTGSDSDGQDLTYAIAVGPTNGALSGTPPNVTYTPNAGFGGVDSFTFTVNDGYVDSAPATVTVGVDNTAPTADAGPDQVVALIEGTGGGDPVPGAYYEWDAAQDTNANNQWESTTAQAYNWTIASGALSPADASDSRFKVTKAYMFPSSKSPSQTTLENTVNENSSGTWEFILDTDADDGLIMESGGTTDGFQFWIAGGILNGQVRDGGTNATVSYSLTTEDKAGFIHIIYVIDMQNSVFKLYVNNVEVDSVPWAGADWCGSDGGALGTVGGSAPAGSVADFTGKIALIRFYQGTAFTPADVTVNFEAALPGASAMVIMAGTMDDADGNDLVATWSLESGPAAVSFSDSGALNTQVRFSTPGVYTLRLTVDDMIDQTSDVMTVEVLDPVPNTPPSVNAGTNQTVTLTQSSGGGGDPVSGAYFEWDAAQDAGGDNLWPSTSANAYDWAFDGGNVSPDSILDARFDRLTHAYAFPAAKVGSSNNFDSFGSAEPATFEFVIDIDGNDGSIFETGASGDGLQIDIVGGVLRGTVEEDPTEARVSYPLTAEDMGRFIHVVFVADNANNVVKLYVDGVLEDSQPWTAGEDWSGTDGASLGSVSGAGKVPDGGSNADFNGQVALMRFYRNKAFNAAEVTTNFNSLSTGSSATVDLVGTVDDPDGQIITTTWSVTSTTPAGLSVQFGDTSLVETTATFVAPGVYTLRLTADDGIDTGYGEVIITVNPAGVGIADVNLPAGISLYGYTGLNPIDTKAAFQTLIDNNQLSLVRWVNPATGNIKELYYTTFPSAGWVNEIGDLMLAQGYVVKTNVACTLSISGNKDTGNVIHDLPAGYSLIGFNKETSQDAVSVFQPLIDAGKLDLVRWVDPSNGSIKELYYTTFPSAGWVNEIGNLTEGQGYIIKLNAPNTGFSIP